MDGSNHEDQLELAMWKTQTKKQSWSKVEDAKLIQLIRMYGPQGWSQIARMMPGRTGKQCHNRWRDCLNPLIKKGSWSKEEDEIIIKLQCDHGNQWSMVSCCLKLI